MNSDSNNVRSEKQNWAVAADDLNDLEETG